jgi:Multicopper oxidase
MKAMDRARRFLCVIVLWTLINLNEDTSAWADICSGPVCTYEFNVTLFRTMTYRDENLHLWPVYLNGTRFQVDIGTDTRTLSPDDIIVADGFERDVIVINGQFPGPTIEVMEGVQVGYHHGICHTTSLNTINRVKQNLAFP